MKTKHNGIFRIEEERRKRCSHIVRDFLDGKSFETVNHCNICGSPDVTIISERDRYGIPVRAAQCNYCGLLFLVDRLSKDDYAKFYEHTYRPLVSAYLGRKIDALSITREQRQYVINLLRSIHNSPLYQNKERIKSLLDVGGSSGMVSSVLCSVLNCQATILDPSPDELKVAAMQGHKTICALLEDMKPNDQRYDLVFCCQTIDHFFNLKESLEKMRNALDHNGFLFIDIIDFDSAWKLKSCIEHVIKIDHCYYLSSENAPLILKSVGLEPVFSEISSHIEHVSYICRPCKPVESFYHLDSWIRSRTRSMQNARINFHMMPDGIPGWRKLAYKLKKIILRGFLSRFC